MNASYAEMLGYSIEEIRGRDVREFIHPEEVPRMMDGFNAMIETGDEIRRYVRRYLHRDGHVVLAELTASFVRDDHGEPIMVIVLVVDITQRHELQQRLRHQAMHDPLTGLPNRTLFQERLQAMFATPGSRVGLCYFDLDRFKAVNDRLGHEVGDGLLVGVADRLGRIADGALPPDGQDGRRRVRGAGARPGRRRAGPVGRRNPGGAGRPLPSAATT